jgi:hypothetical protein
LAHYFWTRNAATTEKHWLFSIGFHRPFKQTWFIMWEFRPETKFS